MKKLKFWLNAKKKAQSPQSGTKESNPFLDARKTWNSHTAGLMSQVMMWQTVGIAALLIALAAVGGVTYIGSKSKFIPLVFERDSSGNTLSMTMANKVGAAALTDYRQTAIHFVEQIRLVTTDVGLQKRAINQAYSYMQRQDPALQKATEYLNGTPERNPLNRAQKETVSVEIKSALQISNDTWQIDWLEHVFDKNGGETKPAASMRAVLTLYQSEPSHDTTSLEAMRNPHFIYVRDFNWSKQL